MTTTDSHSLRNGILATVVGGLVLSTILALVPKAWAFTKLLFGFLSWFLGYKFNTPIWVFIVITAILILLFVRLIHLLELLSRKNHTSAPKGVDYSELSDAEKKVIFTLFIADGKALGLYDIAQTAGIIKLLAEQAIEKLIQKDFVVHSQNWQGTPIFRLSSQGRDYTLRDDYTPPSF